MRENEVVNVGYLHTLLDDWTILEFGRDGWCGFWELHRGSAEVRR